MTRHLSRYLWAAMNDGSRKPAEATRWIKTWGWAGGWPLAWTTDDWRQNSSANRRSRTTASSRARVRCRARIRALRARIRQSPNLLIGVSEFSIRRTFPDISGHSAPVSGFGFRVSGFGFRSVSVSESGMTGWRYGREWFPRLGTGKCQPGVRLTRGRGGERARRGYGVGVRWWSVRRGCHSLAVLAYVKGSGFPLRRE